MIVNVRCRHCGKMVYVEDMGDNAVCPNCGQFIISISEFIRDQINGK